MNQVDLLEENSSATLPKHVNREANAGEEPSPWLLILTALLTATCIELTVFAHSWGWSWAIAVCLVIAAACVVAIVSRRRVPMATWLLAGATCLAAVLTAFRLETFTNVALVLFSLGGMVLLAATFLNGQWWQFRFREHFMQALSLVPSLVAGLPLAVAARNRFALVNPSGARKGRRSAVLRGILIAVPLLLIFGALLSSADSIFSSLLRGIFAWLRWDNMDQVLPRLFRILILAWGLAGALAHVLNKSSRRQELEPDTPLVKPFLGLTEAGIVLGLINLLFAAFLVVQFRYFFAGEANVTQNGLTYAEYAVKGFNELMVVAAIAGLLHFALSGVTRREKRGHKVTFSILAGLLLAQVGVILVSAFLRLSLYENAYGFTQNRLVAHVFMVFFGILLALSVVMEATRNHKRMALALILSVLAFALTLAVVNVDKTIAARNIERALAGQELDANYLANNLSLDAVPVMFEYFHDPELSMDMRNTLDAVLSCQAARLERRGGGQLTWLERSVPVLRAETLFRRFGAELTANPTGHTGYSQEYSLDKGSLECYLLGD